MRRFLTRTGLAVTAVVLLVLAQAAPAWAQYVQVYSPPVVVSPPAYVSYYQPVTTYYSAPVTSYYTPVVTSYYTPAVTYSYYPATTVYAAPAAVVAPTGVVTTRTYTGYGIFRPRGVYTQSYYTPATVVAPTTTYYSPVIWR